MTTLMYADPGTYSGIDEDDSLDSDDEIVFMARFLGEKNEDLKLSEPLADAHAGALTKGKAHKRMNCLLETEDSLVFSHIVWTGLGNLHIPFLISSIALAETLQRC